MKIVTLCALAALAFIPRLHGQLLSFGVKAGVTPTDAIDADQPANAAKRYTIGPMAEIRLPFSFAFEVDALYRRTGYNAGAGGLGTSTFTHLRANTWEFPLLAKYYFGSHGPLRPYATGGYVIRKTTGFDITAHTTGIDIGTGNPINVTAHTSSGGFYVHDDPVSGVAVGGGVRLKAGFLAVSPEVRYTRWTGKTFDQQGPFGYFLHSTQDQVDILVGVTF